MISIILQIIEKTIHQIYRGWLRSRNWSVLMLTTCIQNTNKNKFHLRTIWKNWA